MAHKMEPLIPEAKNFLVATKQSADIFTKTLPTIMTSARFARKLGAFYALIGTTGVILEAVSVGSSFELVAGVKRIAEAQEAAIALESSIKFARIVYENVRCKIDSTPATSGGKEHVYFVYHPDTTWHYEFKSLHNKRPLGDRFLGFSDDLPSLCLWMRFIRTLLGELSRKNPLKYSKDVVFNLVIPVYFPIVIKDPIEFSDELFPLLIHGDVHFEREYVQMNIPKAREGMLVRVRNMYGSGWFDNFKFFYENTCRPRASTRSC